MFKTTAIIFFDLTDDCRQSMWIIPDRTLTAPEQCCVRHSAANNPVRREIAFENVSRSRWQLFFFVVFFIHKRPRTRVNSKAMRNRAGSEEPRRSRSSTRARWASTRTDRTRRWSCTETSSSPGT